MDEDGRTEGQASDRHADLRADVYAVQPGQLQSQLARVRRRQGRGVHQRSRILGLLRGTYTAGLKAMGRWFLFWSHFGFFSDERRNSLEPERIS